MEGKSIINIHLHGMQRTCRYLVEKGADLVICQNHHCIGAYEHYLNGDIVYRQKNSLFDMNHSFSVESLILSYELDKDLSPKLSFIPLKYKDDGSGPIYIVEGKAGQQIIDSFFARSKEILQSGLIEEKYTSFAKNMLYAYLRRTSPLGKWFSRFDRYIFRESMIEMVYPRKKLLILQNIIECEAYKELFLKGLHLNQEESFLPTEKS